MVGSSVTNTYGATDAAGNKATCEYRITVQDNEPPVIHCPEDMVLNTDPGTCTAEVSYSVTSTDSCNDTLQERTFPNVMFPVGSSSREYMFNDDSSNSAKCNFTVQVTDREPPTISCPEDIVMTTDPGTCSAMVQYSVNASDNCDGVSLRQKEVSSQNCYLHVPEP